MRTVVRIALIIGVAAFFPGCGAWQQTSPSSTISGTSQRLPTSAAYLYVSGDYATIYELSYPGGQFIAHITVGGYTRAGCSDDANNVFIADTIRSGPGRIYEFANGGSSPTQTLTESESPTDCSYDTTTGNLAAANASDSKYNSGSVAIYTSAQGAAAIYATPSYFAEVESCAYDNAGDLFVGGVGKRGSGSIFKLSELVEGASSFTQVSLNQQIGAKGSDYGLQWNNGDLTVTEHPAKGIGPTMVYRVRIAGSKGAVKGSTSLTTHSKKTRIRSAYTWIAGGDVLAPTVAGVAVWTYPRAGKRKALFSAGGSFAVVVSSGQ